MTGVAPKPKVRNSSEAEMSSQVTNHWSVDHVSMVTEILRHPDATGLLGTVRNAMREVADSG
jgi:hypothetical protein